jgi:hypothetical protein
VRSKITVRTNVLIVTCSIFFLLLHFYPRITHTSRIEPVIFSGTVIKVIDGPEVCKAWRSLGGSLIISGSATISKTGTYQNLLQTDDLNNGLRLEMSPDFNIGLIIGNATDADFSIIDFGQIKDINRELVFSIFLQGEDVLVEINGLKSSVRLPTRAACANLLVGQGYDASRTYAGKIVVSFETTFDAPVLNRENSRELILFVQACLMLSSAILLIQFMKRNI